MKVKIIFAMIKIRFARYVEPVKYEGVLPANID